MRNYRQGTHARNRSPGHGEWSTSCPTEPGIAPVSFKGRQCQRDMPGSDAGRGGPCDSRDFDSVSAIPANTLRNLSTMRFRINSNHPDTRSCQCRGRFRAWRELLIRFLHSTPGYIKPSTSANSPNCATRYPVSITMKPRAFGTLCFATRARTCDVQKNSPMSPAN